MICTKYIFMKKNLVLIFEFILDSLKSTQGQNYTNVSNTNIFGN